MIEIEGLWKSYASSSFHLYVNHLTINDGEIVGILGGNGSGKTTLLKAIMGLGEIQRGSILIDGRPVTEQYENVAFLTEEGSWRVNLTPRRYAEFLADYYPKFDRELYDRLLQFFNIDANAKIRTFSKGQKSKLEICAGFAKKTKHILMDEPFLGKDMFARRNFLKLMVSQLDGHEIILVSTHLIDEIENVIDRAVILHQGFVKADFQIDDLREEGKTLADKMSELRS